MILFSIIFLFCLVALGWHWHSKPALQRSEPDLSPPTYRRPSARTTVCKTEPAFLKWLIEHDGSKESRQLQDSLAKAALDGRCIHRAMFLMSLLFMLSLAGLAYCAILLPDVFRDTKHVVTLGLCSLGLASLLSQGAFLAYLLWRRLVVRRLHRECRRLVLALARNQPKAVATAMFTDDSPGTTNPQTP